MNNENNKQLDKQADSDSIYFNTLIAAHLTAEAKYFESEPCPHCGERPVPKPKHLEDLEKRHPEWKTTECSILLQ